MIQPPYSLRPGNTPSRRFYELTAQLADETVEEIAYRCADLYRFYTGRPVSSIEAQGKTLEPVYDLLALSVLWREYGRKAQRVSRSISFARRRLLQLRTTLPASSRSWLDPLLARTAGLMLPARGEDSPGEERDHLRLWLTTAAWARFANWLRSSGEYDREAAMAKAFLTRWKQEAEGALRSSNLANVLDDFIELGDWFVHRSVELLHPYTEEVERFRERERASSPQREDLLLRAKPRAVYHLQMTGADLLSRAYRPDYEAAARQLVLVPGCLALRGSSCPAEQADFGLTCTECSPNCRVRTLTALSRQQDFQVRIMPHLSGIFQPEALQRLRAEGTGVIGIACAATLIDGGLKLRKAGIPSQCVLLDSCSCRKHWHPVGKPTDFDLERLLSLLETPPNTIRSTRRS
ncbi:DUF116 domain-containing protein [Gorillibacterium sp. CAU 1737]|uniref:DUF116 domain-containing protein n=1 Tax=Gorillibacterium sp. CAU 1737 TaxID=3140362 RepID=UPI003261C2A5